MCAAFGYSVASDYVFQFGNIKKKKKKDHPITFSYFLDNECSRANLMACLCRSQLMRVTTLCSVQVKLLKTNQLQTLDLSN